MTNDRCLILNYSNKYSAMKQTVLSSILFSLICSVNLIFAQSFINGDFEDNTAVSCEYNLSDIEFNSKINNVVAFGKAYIGTYIGEIDFQTNSCYLDPQSGDWCLGLSSDTTQSSDALSIELSSNLVAGNTYEITCFVYGNTAVRETLALVEIGESLSDTIFGQQIYTATPDTNSWKEVKFTFTASQNSSHITVRTLIGVRGWTQIDNFSIQPATATAIDEAKNGLSMQVYPNPTTSNAMINFGKQITSGTVQLVNVSGQIQSVFELNNNQYLNIDLSKFPVGVYFANIVSNGQNETVVIHKE